MASKNERYLNAPIQLYKDFLINSNDALSRIAAYSCFEYEEINGVSFEYAAHYLGLSYNDYKVAENAAYKIYESIKGNPPKVGISMAIYNKFRWEKEKTEFEKVCLLGHVAIKSILQQKTYCKIDNKFWLSRMDGQPTSLEFPKLSVMIRKYANEYQTRKIKNELKLNWGLVTTSKNTRGFYVSYKLTLAQLMKVEEKNRPSFKLKQQMKLESETRKKVLEELGGNTTM